jgi:hypothetical protein
VHQASFHGFPVWQLPEIAILGLQRKPTPTDQNAALVHDPTPVEGMNDVFVIFHRSLMTKRLERLELEQGGDGGLPAPWCSDNYNQAVE